MHYTGSCHCGQIKFEVDGTLEKAMECNCSHCSRKGYLLWFMPKAELKVLSQPSVLSTYTFNKHVIQHHFCPKCGCAPFGFGRDRTGNEMAAVNVRCIEGVDLGAITRIPVDGRSL